MLRKVMWALCALVACMCVCVLGASAQSGPIGTCFQYAPGAGGQTCLNTGTASGWFNFKGDVTNYQGVLCSPTHSTNCGLLTVKGLDGVPLNGTPADGQTYCYSASGNDFAPCSINSVPSGTNAQLLGYASGTNTPAAFSISGDLGLSGSYAATVNSVLGGKTPLTTLNNATVTAASAAGNVIVQGQNGARLSATTGGIAVRSTASEVSGNVTSQAVNAPAGLANSDVEVACFNWEGGATPVSAIVQPSGWTAIGTPQVGTGSNTATTQCAYHAVTNAGGEPATYTWSWTTAAFMVGGIVDFTGVNNTTPVDVTSGGNAAGGSGDSVTVSSMTPVNQNDTVIAVAGQFAGTDTITPNIPGATSRVSLSNNGTLVYSYVAPVTGAIPSYVVTFTDASARASSVSQVALIPSSVVSGAPFVSGVPVAPTGVIAAGTFPYSTATNPLTGYSHDGYYNVVAYGADPTDKIDSTAAIQAAEVAACAGTGLNGAIPTVWFPAGTYQIGSGPIVDNCASALTFAGVSANSTILTGQINGAHVQEPILLPYPSTYLAGLGSLTGAPLVGSTGNSFNFPSGKGIYYNLNDVMLSSSPNPLNGLSAFTVEVYFNSSSSSTPQALINSQGPGQNDATPPTDGAASLTISSGISGELDVGGTNHTLSGGATSLNTTYWAALSYDGTTIRLYLCTPNQASCAPVATQAATGNVTQEIGEQMIMGIQSGFPEANTGMPFIGTMYSLRISKVARYTGTITAPNAAFTSDANTLLLVNGDKFNSTYGLMGSDTPGSGILVPRAGNAPAQGAAPTIRDMTLTSAAQGVMIIAEPTWKIRNVNINSMSKAGIDAYDNSYSGVINHVYMTNPGLIGVENDSVTASEVAYNLQMTGGYYGLVNPEALYKMIWTPSASGLVGVYWNSNTNTTSGLCSDCLMDVESGGSAVPFSITASAGGAYQIVGGDMQTASGTANSGMTISGNPQISIVGTHWEGSAALSLGVLDFGAGSTGARATWINPVINGSPWTLASTIPISNQMGQTTVVSATELITPNEATVTQASTPTRTTVSGATTLGAQSYQILTMTAAATLTLPSGTYDGQKLSAKVCQNATGGFTPTWAGPISWPSGTAPTPTTTASKCDLYGWLWDATAATWNEAGFVPNE